MTSIFYLQTRFRLHWGFIVRQKGGSSAQPALPIPPPTTIVGFFSEPLYMALNIPENFKGEPSTPGGLVGGPFHCSLKATLAASASGVSIYKVAGVVSTQEISRLIAAPYKSGGPYENLVRRGRGSLRRLGELDFLEAISLIFPVQAVGESIAPSFELDLVWVLDIDSLQFCLNRKLDLEITRQELEKSLKIATWGGTRLGSKEGLGAVVGNAKVGEIKESHIIKSGENFLTKLYVPVKCVIPLTPKFVEKVTMWGLDYREQEYYLPQAIIGGSTLYVTPTSPVEMRLEGDKCKAYDLGSYTIAVGR